MQGWSQGKFGLHEVSRLSDEFLAIQRLHHLISNERVLCQHRYANVPPPSVRINPHQVRIVSPFSKVEFCDQIALTALVI